MSVTTRNRTRKIYGTDVFTRKEVGGSNPVPLTSYSWDVTGNQQTVSEGHPWPRSKGEGWDVGGDFFTKKETYRVLQSLQVSNTQKLTNRGTMTWSGTLHPRVLGNAGTRPLWGSDYHSNSDQLDEWGSTAIAATIPTNPSADTSVFLGEMMREGLPRLIGLSALKSSGARGLASEFLNYEFGIKPLLSDTRKLCEAVVESERILRQLQRDSGKNVRRRYYFDIPPTTTVTDETANVSSLSPWPLLNTNWWDYDTARLTKISTTKRRVWFSGCYTYHIKLDDKSNSRLSETAEKAKFLLGLQLTPEVLWNLSPWSWLVDWVTNLGDIFHNVSAFAQDGLVLRHGYIMENTIRTNVHELVGLKFQGGKPVPGSCSDEFGIDVKQRRKATPFGFGLNADGFDLRQWAILGALGISRSPKQLP